MQDATTITGQDVIEALSRCVQTTLADPPTRDFFETHNPRYVLQAEAALRLRNAWGEGPSGVRVIANFDDTPKDIHELHAYYDAIDNAEEWHEG